MLYPSLATLIYWIGLLGGEGAEFERALLFLTLSIVIAFFTKVAPLEAMMPVLGYSLVAALAIVIAIPILLRVHKYESTPAVSIRSSLKKSWARTKENHIHAASYTAATLLALWLTRHFNVERGYWIVVTVLLVMRADRTLSLYVTAQRLLGTAAAVLAFDLLVLAIPLTHTLLLIAAIFFAAIIPMALKRNYLAASFLVTAFVISLLELGLTHPGETVTAFLRLRATAVGCLLGVVGTLISKLLSQLLLRPSKG